jgi:hypothetical protein
MVGDEAGTAITTGDENCTIGYNAGALMVEAAENTFVGANSAAGDIVTGSNNTSLGRYTINALTGGTGNTALGHQSMLAVNTGSYNTACGKNAGASITSGDNNITIGLDAGITGSPGGAISTADNIIVVGDENITASNIQVDWTVASDERDKTDFTALDLGLDFVKDLNPVTYKWDKRARYIDKDDPTVDLDEVTHDGTHKEDWLDMGFKAQEVEALEKAAGYKMADKTNLTTSLTSDGKQYGIQYSKFIPILVKSIQELSAKVEALEG